MISSQELRLGNWVKIEGKPFQVRYITESGCGQENKTEIGLGQLQPIPITNEFLDLAGFVKDLYGYKNSRLALNQYEEVYYLRIPPGTGFGRGIRYVHQLQNLYYEISGEECKIPPLAIESFNDI